MAIPKVNPRTIILKGKERSVMKELVAAATITPGMQVALTSAGKWTPQATALVQSLSAWAVEYDLTGRGIDDNYSANDWVQAFIVPPGSEINALIPASAVAIVIGDPVTSNGNGMVKKANGTTDITLGYALQAVDNSAGGSAVRLQILTK